MYTCIFTSIYACISMIYPTNDIPHFGGAPIVTWLWLRYLDQPEEDAFGSARAWAHCVSQWGSPESKLKGPAPDSAIMNDGFAYDGITRPHVRTFYLDRSRGKLIISNHWTILREIPSDGKWSSSTRRITSNSHYLQLALPPTRITPTSDYLHLTVPYSTSTAHTWP